MTLKLIAVAGALGVLAGACRRSPPPSPEFEQAHQRFLELKQEQREKAFLDPELDGLLEVLARVPPSSRDAEAARALSTTIREGQASARAHAAELEAARGVAGRVVVVGSGTEAAGTDPGPEETPAEPADPVEPQPRYGMTVAELRAQFSRCFAPGEPLHIPGKGMRDIWVLKDLGVCRQLHPTYLTQVVLLEDGKVWGTATPGPRIEFPADGGEGRRVDAAPAAGR